MQSSCKTVILVICLTLIACLNEKTTTKIKTSKSQNKNHKNKNIKTQTNTNLLQVDKVKSSIKKQDKPVVGNSAPSNISQVDAASDLFTIKTAKCTPTNCPMPNASCLDDKTCKCWDGYANFTPAGQPDSTFYCSYAQKKQLPAFLLEFFFPFGVGHFYAGRTTFGIIKLLICLLPCIVGLLVSFAILSKDPQEGCGLITMICLCALGCTVAVWQLADVIQFGLNNYKDGNGIVLQRW